MRRLALLMLGLACSVGAYALHRLDARADVPVPRVLINDAGYAYLDLPPPMLVGDCVCTATRCYERTDAGFVEAECP